ncbi:RNA polymerase sigma-70 factor (ECF subfamily) [Marinilabilia salmonicolor]|uniref:RNA polymerase sigma-70 factor (ECF subfamily) n=2 Tax=Marinilabilia salmonicolor TaxID=989 RepID=A0A2T0XAL1_9BACT|nr:RNA polymerase sigma-70 factor (ECF subfamily) [Marinilabilia salmonicolor]RCW29125.1 RNA polymerase sigma-70 factor (ECF subfamily) [Marinilabilia salmonicolor]
MTELTILSDEELVKKFISGDSRCIDLLIERHHQRIYSFIFLMVRQRDLAEDIFQDVFVKVIHSLKSGKYAENGRFTSWVMRIAHNLIIDHFRKQKNQQMVSNDQHSFDLFNNARFSDQTIEDQMVHDQLISEVAALVEMLPESQKEVIRLRHYFGLSFKEIAEETNVSINTALGRMRYALINMRKMMEEKNMSLTI